MLSFNMVEAAYMNAVEQACKAEMPAARRLSFASIALGLAVALDEPLRVQQATRLRDACLKAIEDIRDACLKAMNN